MPITKKFILKDGTPLDPLICKILKRQGITDEFAIRAFLEPQLKDLPDPSKMLDMELAASLVGDSIIRGESFLIWGDYDVDGTTATALLLLFLRSLGCEVKYHIPNRLTEGYGLQEKSLEKISSEFKKQPDILITVDNGISAHAAVKKAKALGYKVVITDHHTPPKERVDADAVLNPQQEKCSFPGQNLAGVGVAFYLAIGIRRYLQQKNFFDNADHPVPNLKQLLDLVAIGTVADMVELDSTNRILVRAGMETLAQQTSQGITELCKQSNLDLSMVYSEDISFQLAPKINAAGRLGCAEKALSLLITRSKDEAVTLTSALISNNEERKAISLANFSKAKDEVSANDKLNKYSTIVSGQYHIGVAGIVASNLVEKYEKPALVLCMQEGDILKGSARSIKGVNLFEALSDCEAVLIGFGGHVMAAGMSLRLEDLSKFTKLFEAAVYKQNQGVAGKTGKHVEADIEIAHLFTAQILKQLPLLEPHGTGNPQPIFRDASVVFAEARPVGKDKSHLQLSITLGATVVKGIGFGLGRHVKECRSGRAKQVLYSPSLNVFRGRRSWQVMVHEITEGTQ